MEYLKNVKNPNEPSNSKMAICIWIGAEKSIHKEQDQSSLRSIQLEGYIDYNNLI